MVTTFLLVHKIYLQIFAFIVYLFLRGGMAQLGARLTGSQEVRGSSPLISTKNKEPLIGSFLY